MFTTWDVLFVYILVSGVFRYGCVLSGQRIGELTLYKVTPWMTDVLHPMVGGVAGTWSVQSAFKTVHVSIWKAFAGAVNLSSSQFISVLFNLPPIPKHQSTRHDDAARTKMRSRNAPTWWNAPEVGWSAIRAGLGRGVDREPPLSPMVKELLCKMYSSGPEY